MLVRELMTSPATSLRVGSRVEEAIDLLADQHISAVPIVDDGDAVVGIVSEADILRARIVPDPRAQLRPVDDAVAPWAARVDDLKTTDPVTVEENGDVGWVAGLLADTGWRSLPVLAGRRLVGIVSRSDVIRALATPDEQIQRRIADDYTQIGRQAWLVEVADGVVTIRGPRSGREAAIAKAIAETAPGVRRIVVEGVAE